MKKSFATTALMALLAGATVTPALAADHEVRMLNRGEAGIMVFEPAFLKIASGDTVTFVPTDRSHNAESVDAMTPDGATPFRGGMNKEVKVTFETEGIYGYKCRPHYAMGMVGIVEVGNAAANLDTASAVKHPGKAAKVMNALISRAGQNVAAAQ